MKVIFGFCNTIKGSDSFQKNGYSQLCILDIDTSLIFFLKLPLKIKGSGIVGINSDKDYIYAIVQSKTNPLIVKVDKKSLRVVKSEVLLNSVDPHSLLASEGYIYITSTGTNSIEVYDSSSLFYKGCYWQHPGTNKKSDQVHLNSIFKYKKSIWASCFGRKNGSRWYSAKKGYLINTKDGKVKYAISHPHSSFSKGSDIYYCESISGTVFKNGNKMLRFPGNYIRGLDTKDSWLVLGVSSGRKKSRSMGITNTQQLNQMFVSVTSIVILNLETKKKISFDLTRFGKEIYDVKFLDDSICRIPFTINGIESVESSSNPRENVLISEIYKQKEDLEKELIITRSYIQKMRSSRFFKLFNGLIHLEENLFKLRR